MFRDIGEAVANKQLTIGNGQLASTNFGKLCVLPIAFCLLI